jgi:4-hydroxy-3-methylbut-2-enyl diphosphate reductase
LLLREMRLVARVSASRPRSGDARRDYDGRLVDLLRARGNTLAAGGLEVRLAREFGFCYGVERAVDYAYQTRSKFPERRVWLAGEIIHNPHVNARLREMGVGFLAMARSRPTRRRSTTRRWRPRTW